MNKKFIYNLIILGIIGVLSIVFFAINQQRQSVVFTEAQAIDFIKQKYPELKDYPSDNLPPKSIVAEKDGQIWHIAFVQNGSGRPIIEARCFVLGSDKSIEEKKYIPLLDETNLNFSAKKCECQ